MAGCQEEDSEEVVSSVNNKETDEQNVKMDTDDETIDKEDYINTGKEKLSESFNEGDLGDKIFEYEDLFNQNDYAGDIEADSQTDFSEGSGDINVLISAPHTTTHIREDEVKDAEIYTGSIAMLIQEYTGAHVIYNVHEGEDSNYVIGGNYKEKIGDIIKDHDIDVVIDLHGAGENREFDLDIGTDYGQTVSDERIDLLKHSLADSSINQVYVDDTFTASDEGTITNHTWNQYDTEAMQLEIHYDYRNPRNDIDSYFQMLKSLVFFVENTNLK